ncbi:MAG: TetR/AcrR family transcriptional regulator [Gammaproteobacteria bacterium]
MRGRPVSFEVEEAIEAAMQIFCRQGYSATSVSDLLAATRLSRSSLYQTFTSKEDLFKSCLQRYSDRLARQLDSNLKQSASARKFIESTFLHAASLADEPDFQQGCLAMNTAIELGHTDSALSQEVHQGLHKFSSVFTSAVKRAQAEGTIDKNKSANILGQYLVSSMCGLRMLIKCGVSVNEATRVVRTILRALD